MNIQNKPVKRAQGSEPQPMPRKMAGQIVSDGKRMSAWLAKREQLKSCVHPKSKCIGLHGHRWCRVCGALALLEPFGTKVLGWTKPELNRYFLEQSKQRRWSLGGRGIN